MTVDSNSAESLSVCQVSFFTVFVKMAFIQSFDTTPNVVHLVYFCKHNVSFNMPPSPFE